MPRRLKRLTYVKFLQELGHRLLANERGIVLIRGKKTKNKGWSIRRSINPREVQQHQTTHAAVIRGISR